VEAVDPVFQAKMLDMLKQTGRLVVHNNNNNTNASVYSAIIIS